MANTFETFVQQLQRSEASEILCLSAQAILSLIIIRNLRMHWNEFPIKQLSPLCTLTALLSFFLLNLLSYAARIIEGRQHLYHYPQDPAYADNAVYDDSMCGQCRLYNNIPLQILAIIYSGLRQLPLTLFALKTLRVCICFLDYKNKHLPKVLQLLFGNEKWLLMIALAYSATICGMSWDNVIASTPYSTQLTEQFLCPKQGGTFDQVITVVRYLSLAVSYSLSILVYRELDFKRFIFFIFVLSNIQVLMRCIFVFVQIDSSSYHQFYYHSIFLNFCGTLILYPYTNFNRYVKQPPSTAVLESFDAFLNCSPGITIIKCYATYLDQINNTKKHEECFDSYIRVRAIKMQVSLQPKKIAQVISQLEQILEIKSVAAQIVGADQLLQKVKKRECGLGELKRVQKSLMDFCQKQLYDQWKKTESRAYIEQQFQKNVLIDERMNQLGINLVY